MALARNSGKDPGPAKPGTILIRKLDRIETTVPSNPSGN